ncbi:DUF1302 family protein [Prosthecochloris sp.]|uniref:DUF1302 family protein n=1 Tax=Prosthecochloris sp. TaxID=290513 RepID=UPI0025F10E22|nr:DUF1302 family protein [Prosthecochloris sp.]
MNWQKKLLQALVVAVGYLPFTGSASAADESSWMEWVEVDGWVEGARSVRNRSPHDALVSRVWGRLKLSSEVDDVYAHLSVDAQKNWRVEDETGIDLHEIWAEYTAEGWDVRVGRQVIIWGKADGVQITDIVSPPDYTEFITRDLEEIRLPVDAVMFRLLGDEVDVELIWIPVFRAAVQPSADNPWALEQDIPDDVRVMVSPVDEPETSLENSEIALKVSAFWSGLDVAVSVFHTWDDNPVMYRTITGSDEGEVEIHFSPEHRRMTVFGLEFSRPLSDFVFRGEAAYYLGRFFEPRSITGNPLEKNALQWLGGVDWTPGNDWSVITQLTGTAVMNHESEMAAEKHAMSATLHVSKKLMRQTLTLSNMLYYDIGEQDFFDQIKAEYAVRDDLHLFTGVDVFGGGGNSFGRYRDNSQIWVKAKYSF